MAVLNFIILIFTPIYIFIFFKTLKKFEKNKYLEFSIFGLDVKKN